MTASTQTAATQTATTGALDDTLDAPASAAPASAEPEAPPDPRLMVHAYDDIREYDNPLPGWWSATFWGTIVFSIGYAIYFHGGRWGATDDERYQVALAAHQQQRALGDNGGVIAVSEESLAAAAASDQEVGRGKTLFGARCASCHAADGSGQIGPNLTDSFQLHGTARLDLYSTISNGVPGTAMIGWREQMSPEEVVAAAAYVITLRGKNLPGKASEGAPVGPFGAPGQ